MSDVGEVRSAAAGRVLATTAGEETGTASHEPEWTESKAAIVVERDGLRRLDPSTR